ncbi:hypothetical protein BV20DRAFT_1055100 [Pilatotrama ljubarskyi]|nr:hypothetical protein BV20DRAFT_1055100 [Pilatotrama ljubarskyi]
MPAKGSRGGAASGAKTTPSDASRIQSTQAKSGKDTGKDTFPARAQSAAARNASGSPPKAPKAPKA